MRLTPALREVLKRPLGTLVSDVSDVPRDALLICVGDTAADSLISAGYRPKLVVYDGMTRRNRVGVSEAIRSYDAREYRVANPAGHLNREVFGLFRELLKAPHPGRVFVDGEEDLTALAAIVEAPLGSVVVYGQPGEGLVVVGVDEGIKDMVGKIIEEMEDGG